MCWCGSNCFYLEFVIVNLYWNVYFVTAIDDRGSRCVCGGGQKSTMWSPELFMDPKVCLIVVVTCSVMSLSSSRYVFLSERCSSHSLM